MIEGRLAAGGNEPAILYWRALIISAAGKCNLSTPNAVPHNLAHEQAISVASKMSGGGR